jgi:hypothetical protein
VDAVRFVIDRVRQYGWLRSGWLGMRATDMTKDMTKGLGQTHAEG